MRARIPPWRDVLDTSCITDRWVSPKTPLNCTDEMTSYDQAVQTGIK